MNIWGMYRGKIEKIDTCKKSDANYLVGEYRMAYGKDWIVWAGNKCEGEYLAEQQRRDEKHGLYGSCLNDCN